MAHLCHLSYMVEGSHMKLIFMATIHEARNSQGEPLPRHFSFMPGEELSVTAKSLIPADKTWRVPQFVHIQRQNEAAHADAGPIS